MLKINFVFSKKMKNFGVLLLVGMLVWSNAFCAFAQDEGGKIILDLQEDEDNYDRPFTIQDIVGLGYKYAADVKNYDEQLKGVEIEKDFSHDIRSEYPMFNDDFVQLWQKSVRAGVQGQRFFKILKDKVINWIVNPETPIVVADDQYEMGYDEVYIETDKPIVIENFKKIVAYSKNKKDQLAIKEKIAKDHNLTPPSQKFQKYKKALLERDWKTLFGFDLDKHINRNFTEKQEIKQEANSPLKGKIVSRYDGVADDGKFSGVLIFWTDPKGFVLLRNYKTFEGITVDYSKSENIENINVNFIWPQLIKFASGDAILGYGNDFPVYFSGIAKDPKKKVSLAFQVNASVCRDNLCQKVETNLKLHLDAKKVVKQTNFAPYTILIQQNIPHQSNEKYYDFRELVWEPATQNSNGHLRLRVRTDDSVHLNILMLGREVNLFKAPSIQLDGRDVIVRYEALEQNYDPKGKTFRFWVMTNSVNQYLKTMEVSPLSSVDVMTSEISFGVLLLAFVGGILLNFMPCVFPVLSLKLLAFTKFGGLSKTHIRQNFFYNIMGIFTAFLLIAVCLTGLKMAGYILGWGMQFQNIYFLVAIIWLVVLFLAHVFGFIQIGCPDFAGKLLIKEQSKNKLFEFLSGVLLVLLSTPCMAPYLGTVFGIALAGGIVDIWLVILMVGLGLAVPYMFIFAVPQVAIYMPKPGKWIDFINLVMVLMLVVTLGWLVSILVAQTSSKEIWHWVLYILGVLLLLLFRKTVKSEIDKLSDPDVIKKLSVRAEVVFGLIFLVIFLGSTYDAVSSRKYQQFESQGDKFLDINEAEIKHSVKKGYKVLVKVGADWCLTCKYNDALVFKTESIQDTLEKYQVAVYEVDWTQYNVNVLKFMKKYGRLGLPFYILFSPKFPEGIVLPEMPDAYDLELLLEM